MNKLEFNEPVGRVITENHGTIRIIKKYYILDQGKCFSVYLSHI